MLKVDWTSILLYFKIAHFNLSRDPKNLYTTSNLLEVQKVQKQQDLEAEQEKLIKILVRFFHNTYKLDQR